MTPLPSTDELLAQAGWVRALARRLARDAASADDLAQSALAAALERPPDPGRPLRPWLARVLSNLARKERRGAALRVERERSSARSAIGPDAGELLAELEEQQRLARLVAALPEPYRTVVLRRYYRGESAAAIARALGLPEATVRSQLSRGLARLRAVIERGCDGDRKRTLALLVLAAGGRDALAQTPMLPTTLLVMNTATKVTVLTAAAAVVCASTWFVLSGSRGDGVRPTRRELAAAPTSTPPAAPGGAELASDVQEPARIAVADHAQGSTSMAEAPVPPPAAHVVFLRAVDESGIPIAGARLQPVTERGAARDVPPSAPSGADGRVELALDRALCFQYVGRESANAYLSLQAPGYATAFFVGTVTLGGRHDQGDRVLAPGGGVSGFVVDAAGRAVEGATVIAISALVGGDPAALRITGPDVGGGRPTVSSDASGRFEVAGVGVGPTRVWAHADGFQWAFSDSVEIEARAIVHDVQLVLEPLPADARIGGRVVAADGAAVAGARITYRAPEHETEQLTTDDAGRFAIDLRVRAPLVLVAYDPAGRHGPARPLSAAPGDLDVVVALTPRRTVRVRAEDAEGRPVVGAGVIAIVVDSDEDYMSQKWQHTGEDGRVELLARGAPFRVHFSVQGYESLLLGPFDPEVLPTEEVVGRLVRQSGARGVVTHDGTPVAGALIELVHTLAGDSREITQGFPGRYWLSGGGGRIRTDANGRFSIPVEEQEGSRSVLLVEKEGLALAEHPLDADDSREEIAIELTAGGTLEGSVRVPSNRSREGVLIGANRGDGRPRFTRTDASGRYRFRNLAPGPWHVEDRWEEPEGRMMSTARAEEAPYDWNCEVREGAVTVFDVDLRWQEDLRVHGRLAFDGVGAAGWSAVIESAPSADREFHLRPGVLDAQGRFAVEAQPGPVKLVVRSPAGETPTRVLTAELRVTEGLQPLELDLATGTLTGRAAPGARVRIFHPIQRGMHLECELAADESGDFRVSVPAGPSSWQERAGQGKGWREPQRFTVVAGETTDLR